MTARFILPPQFLLCFLLVLICFRNAEAVPSFTRQYNAECTTCHTIIPERNQFGDVFEKNSFVLPGKLPQKASQPVQPEASLEKANEALLKSGIPALPPVSFLGQHDIVYNRDRKPQLDLDAETEFELFAAGSLLDRAGFLAVYNFAPDKEIDEVFVQLRKPLDLPLNVKVGSFVPKLSLWKPNDRPGISKFGYNKTEVDDGNFTIASTKGGVEINSVVLPRLFLAAGVRNGFNTTTNSKDWYGHVSTRIGGSDFIGTESDVDFDSDSIWDYLSLTVGGFGYVGASEESTNDYFRTGLESDLVYKRLRMRLGTVYGRDDNPGNSGQREDSLFFMAQAQYLLGSKLLPSFRFEYEDIEHQRITRRYISSVSYAMLQNLRLAGEYLHETATARDTTNEVKFRITYVF